MIQHQTNRASSQCVYWVQKPSAQVFKCANTCVSVQLLAQVCKYASTCTSAANTSASGYAQVCKYLRSTQVHPQVHNYLYLQVLAPVRVHVHKWASTCAGAQVSTCANAQVLARVCKYLRKCASTHASAQVLAQVLA